MSSQSEHHKILAAAYLILLKEGNIFLMRRANTGYQDGNYGLPSGHLEEGEHPSATAVREALEEAGVAADPAEMECVHIAHRHSHGQGTREYADFFFATERWQGEPRLMEENKCDDCGWFPLSDLPPNTIRYIRDVLDSISRGELYSEL